MSVNLLNQIYNNGKSYSLKYDKLAEVSITKTLRIKLCHCYQLKMTPNINIMTLKPTFLLKIKLQKRQSKMLTCPRNLCLDFLWPSCSVQD